MLTRTLRFMNSTSKTSASFKSFLKHHEAAWFRWVRENPSKKTFEWHWEESTPSLNFRFSRYMNLQSPHIPSTAFCFFGKTNWAVSWEAHKQRGTGLAQSWGMLGAKLSLCRMYFPTSGLLILPCHEDTAPGALTPSSFPAPSSSLSWSGGRQNYLQRSLLLFHCLNPASNHPAATSKIIPLPPLVLNLWRVHSEHFLTTDQRYQAPADGTEIYPLPVLLGLWFHGNEFIFIPALSQLIQSRCSQAAQHSCCLEMLFRCAQPSSDVPHSTAPLSSQFKFM